jgi:hypothetical protein
MTIDVLKHTSTTVTVANFHPRLPLIVTDYTLSFSTPMNHEQLIIVLRQPKVFRYWHVYLIYKLLCRYLSL